MLFMFKQHNYIKVSSWKYFVGRKGEGGGGGLYIRTQWDMIFDGKSAGEEN